MRDFTVALARLSSELLARFQDQRLKSASRKSTRHREPCDSGTYDGCIQGVPSRRECSDSNMIACNPAGAPSHP